MKHGLLLLALLLVATGCTRTKAPEPQRPTRSIAAPVIERPAPEPQAPVREARWFQPRSSWAGQAIDTSNVEPMEPIYRLTVHHSGNAEDTTVDAKVALRQFERAHKGKGWACVGYHFIIGRDGTVYEGRPLKYQGAHATGENNRGNVGICLIGNFDLRSVPKAQLDSLRSVLERLRRQYDIPRSEVRGHSHYKTTECPGKYLRAWVERYRTGG